MTPPVPNWCDLRQGWVNQKGWAVKITKRHLESSLNNWRRKGVEDCSQSWQNLGPRYTCPRYINCHFCFLIFWLSHIHLEKAFLTFLSIPHQGIFQASQISERAQAWWEGALGPVLSLLKGNEIGKPSHRETRKRKGKRVGTHYSQSCLWTEQLQCDLKI